MEKLDQSGDISRKGQKANILSFVGHKISGTFSPAIVLWKQPLIFYCCLVSADEQWCIEQGLDLPPSQLLPCVVETLWPHELPGPSVHGISQVRVLEWVVVSFSRGSSQGRDQICVSCISRRVLYHWATRETPLPCKQCRVIIVFLTSFCDYCDEFTCPESPHFPLMIKPSYVSRKKTWTHPLPVPRKRDSTGH